jgi:hypothetical protein
MKTRSLAAAVAALLLGPITAWADPIVVFTPSAATVNTGGTLTITVGVTGLTAGGLPLSDYDLAVSFDTSLMSLATNPYMLDPAAVTYLGGGDPSNVLGAQPIGTNYLEDQETSLLSLFSPANLATAQSPGGSQVDGFNLFEVAFDVLGTSGTGAAADFSLATLSSTYPYSPTLDVQDPNTGAITSYIPTASLCVNVNDPTACSTRAVPEPASYSLVLLGLLAAGVAWRQARSSAKTKA